MVRRNTNNLSRPNQNRRPWSTRRSNRGPLSAKPVYIIPQHDPPNETQELYDPLWILMPLTEGFLKIYAVFMVIACFNAIGVGVLGIWTKLEMKSARMYYCRFIPEDLC